MPHIHAHCYAIVLGHPGGQDPGDRAGRRRRLRLEARRVRRGACSSLACARKLGRPVKWIEERSEDCRRHDPRPRPRSRTSSSPPTTTGKMTGVTGAAHGGDGRLPPARHARASRCSAPGSTAACYDVAGVRLSLHRRVHATRRRPTRTAAPAGPRPRTRSSGRWTRWRAEVGKDPVEIRRKNFITRVPAPRSSPASTIDSRRLRRVARQGARAPRLRRALRPSRPPGGSAGTRSSSASASRRTSRCAASRPSRILGALKYGGGGWEAATVRCLPDRHGAGRHRHLAARPGSRDDMVADRRRPAGRRRSTRSSSSTATPRSPRSGWTPTAAGASPSAASRSGMPPRRSSTRRSGSPPTSSRWPRTTSSSRAGRSRVRGGPDKR